MATSLLLMISAFMPRFLAWARVNAEGAGLGIYAALPDLATATPTQFTITNSTTDAITASPTSEPTAQPSATLSPTASRVFDTVLAQGSLILSLREGGYQQLFAYQPATLPFTRLTAGPWDDLTPAISPNQKQVAFASNRDGQWDLYLLDLVSGGTTRLTDTPEYDGAPSWSPDGLFLAYETYAENLEIMIRPVDGSQPPFSLSAHPSADFAPSWSPRGRQIAFVSWRSGEPEVWLADLDRPEGERNTNLSQSPTAAEAHPVWSPDGSHLAWTAGLDGAHGLLVWNGSSPPRLVGSGDWPAWSPDGKAILSAVVEPNRELLVAYGAADGMLAMPPVPLPGSIGGLAWSNSSLANPLPEPLRQASLAASAPLWEPALTRLSDLPSGRYTLAALTDVQTPYPLLHDQVNESFQALRARVTTEVGWDALASLENAFVPLTAPLPPGLGDDWLYTGRAFAFNPLPVDAGWMAIVPQDFAGQRYWRVYLRARFQDGSQGKPMVDRPWDFNARNSGDPQLYEQGGKLTQEIPTGYWLDFTALAAAYGWERLPALFTWRSSYPAARFNEFVFSGGLDWRAAMLELYPPEILVTPTALVPPTLTPTPTPRWYRTPTPTSTPTTPPTLTPLPPIATP
ncbi:MAG TPA: hypothetical protein VJ436_03340 [Anaerolineales bacterium]|nr:hypothetical protein [Anaerolineales bacterium]